MKMREPDHIYREIQGMTDPGGWKAVFVEQHEHGFLYLTEEPLVGWASVIIHGVYMEQEMDVPIDTEISGLIARQEVEEASLSSNFMGYLGPEEDRNIYLDEIEAKFAEIKEEELEPEIPDEPHEPPSP